MKIIYLTDSYEDNNELCEAAGNIIESLMRSIESDQDIKDQINNLIGFRTSGTTESRFLDNVSEAVNREIRRLEEVMHKEYRKKASKLEATVKKELLHRIFPK